MKILLSVLSVLLFFCIPMQAQTKKEEVKVKNTIHIIEDFILTKQLDSAAYYVTKAEKQTDYLALLEDVISGKSLDYESHREFISRTSKRRDVDYNLVSDYINTYVPTPDSTTDINVVYADLKISQITKIRDESDLDKSSSLHKALDTYIAQFDQDDQDVIRTKAAASTHNIVLHIIQKDLEKAKEIISKNQEIAKKYDDKKLAVISLYLLSDVLVLEGKLQEYIDVSEESLVIESQMANNTEYHFNIILHLIDAYLYKGGHEERVVALLDEVYEPLETRVESYSMYAKYLSTLPTNSDAKKNIFKKFGVTDVKEFALLAVNETTGVLHGNDYFSVFFECARALEKDNFLKDALIYKEETVLITRRIYSENLSKSLATFQTDQAIKIKDIEIKNEKARSKLYVTMGLIVGFFFLASLFFLVKSRKQSKILNEKNKIIDQSLKEKELLVKEVHHRVKNNFQIVSSLLELQTKDIEDEKALELANQGKNRVKSMALIHQKLYQNEEGLIDFEEYIQSLVREITAMYASTKEIKTVVDSAEMYFDVDTAIPLGLIINEIITNSYKYAFDKEVGNELYISIKKSNNTSDYTLTIADNGPGLDENINWKKVKSLGLRLITRLVKQLQGNLKQTNENGAKFVIKFKDITVRRAMD